MRGQHAERAADFRAQHPAERVDHVRTDRAESAAAHGCVGPPVPCTIGDAAIIGSKHVVAVTDGADGAGLQHAAHCAATV